VAEQCGRALLKFNDGRVFAVQIIPERGVESGFAHAARRDGERIGAEINHVYKL
jgi:hypothetical protein